jgi:hypothetical protein
MDSAQSFTNMLKRFKAIACEKNWAHFRASFVPFWNNRGGRTAWRYR